MLRLWLFLSYRLDLDSLLAPFGIAIPIILAKLIRRCVSFPVQVFATTLEQSVRAVRPESHLQPPELTLSQSCPLKDIFTLVHELREFLAPFLSSSNIKDVLVFFTINSSALFNRHIKVRLKPPQQVSTTPLSSLQDAVQETALLLRGIIDGTATYGAVTANEAVELSDLDIEREFAVLERSQHALQWEVGSHEGLSGMKSMLEVFKYAHHVRVLENTLKLYELYKCLNDFNFKKICDISHKLDNLTSRTELTPRRAAEFLREMKKALNIPKGLSSDCLNCLDIIGQSQVFIEFVVKKRFVGPQGFRQFRLQYEIITAQLQHTDYDEHVLNQLGGAVKFISPFAVCILMEEMEKSALSTLMGAMNRDAVYKRNESMEEGAMCNFEEVMEEGDTPFQNLMSQLMAQDRVNGPKQLGTVNRNMHQIQLWFSQVEVMPDAIL